MPPKSLLGWHCTNCTYFHNVPHPRCAMCMELRGASRREMMAFIQGKPFPKTRDGNLQEVLDPDESKSTGVQTQIGNSPRQKRSLQLCPNGGQHKHPEKARSPRSPEKKNSNSLPDCLETESSSGKPITTSCKKAKEIDPKSGFGPVYSRGPVPIDSNTCKTWIYPLHNNFQMRQYQLEISQTAVLYNTLVSLPTGLGKTLIAAVVLFNYYRWFPEGKVLFLAPTLPLVSQQAEACYNIMGIPEKDTAVLTGRLKPALRFEMWRSRRVFYCTPQTVQKDLLSEDGTSFASKVCCIVLDEAHKASGDYAYTKVIEQLELAGAQFRIVGLSATPGTSIKAIQQVVESLRAVKIEARHEADSSVASYIHQKHLEIVIVPKNEFQKDVERSLTRMLQPILQNLKARGALMFAGGNATVTTFQIHKSRIEYLRRNGSANGSLYSCFQAAHKLIELRNDACQSLGCVKLKIQRLKQTPQQGILAKLVKSTDFEELIRRVLEATGSSEDPSVERFNPKLQKLAELLNEHFSRAKAGGRSSRAIVFSELRDSVSEIARLLEKYHPLIRARHFVGQQGSKRPVGNGDNRLGGMKQSMQQQVIHWFRDDVYNVLVCTCIGEEGLDIGDVDLIVNFDTVRSPIRMIQRTGRTGRKRDGRVVCLVSEGREERTYRASKQAEKTLMRALQKCGSFKMAVHKPMLPGKPSREFAEIEVRGRFRLSLVGQPASGRQTKIQSWNLDAPQEEERKQLLGKIIPTTSDWKTVRALLLRSWCGSGRVRGKGESTQMLQKLSGIGPVKAAKLPRRSLACVPDKVFPVARHPTLIRPVKQARAERAAKQLVPNLLQGVRSNTNRTPDASGSPIAFCSAIQGSGDIKGRSNVGGVLPPVFRLPTPPSSSGEEDSVTEDVKRPFRFRLPTQDSSSSEEEDSNSDLSPTSIEAHGQTSNKMDIVSNMTHLRSGERHWEHSRAGKLDTPDTLRGFRSDNVDSTLISKTGLKDSLDKHLAYWKQTDNSDTPLICLKRKTKDRPLVELKRPHRSHKKRKQRESEKDFGSVGAYACTKVETRSTSEDSKMPLSRTMEANPRDLEPATAYPRLRGTQKIVPRKLPAPVQSFFQPSNEKNDASQAFVPTTTPCKATTEDFGEDPSTIFSSQQPRSGLQIDSMHDDLTCNDVLVSDIGDEWHYATPGVNTRSDRLGELTDTPDSGICINPENMECARCYFGESIVSNPIVLCDGRCYRGFHKLCCSIDIDLDSADRWLCQECSTAKEELPKKRITRKHSIRDEFSTKENIEIGSQPVDVNENEHRNMLRKKEKIERLQAQRLGAAKFVLDEAEIVAFDDIQVDDAENGMVGPMEEEENYSDNSFINDSTQLTQHYSDDELGKADPDTTQHDNDFHHRNLDAEFDRENQFVAPVLNRRAAAERCDVLSEPSSQKGLGNMHFIRSVLQHHQQGGRAEEIETYFQNLQRPVE